MNISARRVREGILLEVLLGRIRLVLPPSAVVELHPVIFPILYFARVLEGLSEEVSEVVVVWGIFETEVADVS